MPLVPSPSIGVLVSTIIVNGYIGSRMGTLHPHICSNLRIPEIRPECEISDKDPCYNRMICLIHKESRDTLNKQT